MNVTVHHAKMTFMFPKKRQIIYFSVCSDFQNILCFYFHNFKVQLITTKQYYKVQQQPIYLNKKYNKNNKHDYQKSQIK